MENINHINKMHKLVLNNRKQCNLSGVMDVLSFDTGEVLLETEQGMLTIKGEELHVSRLTLEKGEVDIEGRIDSFVYSASDSFKSKGESLISRLFR